MQFTAFVDFLGFSEASKELKEPARLKVLDLLKSLVALRSNFSATATSKADGSREYRIVPAISTFSDHIVVSYALDALRETATGDMPLWFLVLPQFQRLVSTVASQALRLGFLIRGGVSVGRLHHAEGVIFGEALVAAVNLEQRVAVYPRIVVSPNVVAEFEMKNPPYLKRDEDGIFYVNYMFDMMFNSAPQGDTWAAEVLRWFDEIIPIVDIALKAHLEAGRLDKFAKWAWFAKHFRAEVAALPREATDAWHMSVEKLSWDV